jgi:hypothetical protein
MPPLTPPPAAAAAAPRPTPMGRRRPSVSSAAEAPQQQQQGGGQPSGGGGFFVRLFAGFDRLPAQTQMVVLTVLGLTAFSVVPFLQPTFLYGSGKDGSAAGGQNNIATVAPLSADARTGKPLTKRARARAERDAARELERQLQLQRERDAAEAAKYQRMREIPVAGPVLGYLQDCAMPQKLPDGRTESPGAVRIYFASLVLLGVFYAASAVLQVLINIFVAVLVKVGILHVRKAPGAPPSSSQPQQPPLGGAAA